ncbi:MAG TPA: hypothetical protein VGM27_08565 [Acidobacteriaceae bacterium]
MTARLPAVIFSALFLAASAPLRGEEVVVPAGTILQCTLNEPNLSSKTAEAGDPVLCDVGPLYVFGVPVLPRGAYLEGRFADFRDPGHFWGKGWMQLDFDKILLPGAEIPLSTKVTKVQHLRVDAQGKVHGGGHTGRDIAEWSIPVLWPEKIVTLPMRGPRPALKGEARISLKLMQDLPIPEDAADISPNRRLIKPGAFRPDPAKTAPALNQASTNQPSTAPSAEPVLAATSDQGTALVLKRGGGMLVRDYWFENGERIRYHSFDGSEGLLPIQALDLGRTVRLNRERGVDFVISSVRDGS